MRRSKAATMLMLATVAVMGPATTAAGAPAASGPSDRWTTFFDSGPLQGVGWSACPDPIRISLDTPLYYPETASRFATALTNAVGLWTKGAGLRFIYDGMVPVAYDNKTGVTSPKDGVNRERHMYFAVIPDKKSGLLDDRVVGLGAPTAVDSGNHEITQADITFEYEYVKKVSIPELTALFAHELGHALGLGHSRAKTDVMYPIVAKAKRLGSGDIAGIKAITRPCPSTDPSRDYPMPG